MPNHSSLIWYVITKCINYCEPCVSVFTASKSITTFPLTCCWTICKSLQGSKCYKKQKRLVSYFGYGQIETECTQIMYPHIVHHTHSIKLYGQMMRINRKTTGTMAMWFVNLSNQWKSRNRKWLWCLCFFFPKGYSSLWQTVQSLWNTITQYKLLQGDFLTVDYFLTFLFDK